MQSREHERRKLQAYSIQIQPLMFDPSVAKGGAFITNDDLEPLDALDTASLLLAGVVDHYNSTLNEANHNFVLSHAVRSAKAILDSLIVKEI